MDQLRQANNEAAMLNHDVQTVTHPGEAVRWKIASKNPLNRLKWQFNNKKNEVEHPIQYQENKAKWKMNSMNPFYYMKNIKQNLVGAFSRGGHQ